MAQFTYPLSSAGVVGHETGFYPDKLSTQVGETGAVSLTNSIDDGSVTASVSFSKTYSSPVVTTYIATRGGGQSIDARVQNLTGSGCDIFMEEPDNGGHANETVCYWVLEAGGPYSLGGGLTAEAGTVSTSSTHTAGSSFGGVSVSLAGSYSSTPAIIHALNTYNNGAFMSTVAHSATSSGFTVQQEAAGSGSSSTTETIGWIAVARGTATSDGSPIEAGHANDGSNDGFDDTDQSISWKQSYSSAPDAAIKGHTGNGTDGYWARSSGTYSSSGAGVYAEEDQVADTERGHTNEHFGWVAAAPGTLLMDS